jgi:hypothetical protein
MKYVWIVLNDGRPTRYFEHDSEVPKQLWAGSSYAQAFSSWPAANKAKQIKISDCRKRANEFWESDNACALRWIESAKKFQIVRVRLP